MAAEKYQSYKAWDRTTRIFHWVNALSIILLMTFGSLIFYGGDFGFSGDSKLFMKKLHTLVGYVFAVNLIWRVIWGFIGSPSARWSKILPFYKGYGADLKAYIAGEKSGEPIYYVGRNPLARLAVTLLFILCISQAVTGLVVAGTDIYFPPFGAMITEWVAASGVDPNMLVAGSKELVDPEAYKEMRAFRSPYITLHVYGFYTLLAFVFLHIFVIIRSEIKQGGGLISAMITGKKVLPEKPVDLEE